MNDVVLTVVSGALGRWLRGRGVRTEGLELRALVPVSIRSEDERGSLGNRIAAMRAPLPVYAGDPVERLEIVRESMGHLKESKQALGAEVIAGLTGFAPPTLLAQASRLNFSTRLFNLIVTNVPGPQFPLYMLGREMESIVPIAFLPENHAMAVAIMSYNGKLHFGLLGDYDAMGDLERFGKHLDEALAELLAVARRRTAKARSGERRQRVGQGQGLAPGREVARTHAARQPLGAPPARCSSASRRASASVSSSSGAGTISCSGAYSASRASLTFSQVGARPPPRSRLRWWPGSHSRPSAAYTGSSAARTRTASATTITAPTWAPPATRRWPVPASFSSPRALTL